MRRAPAWLIPLLLLAWAPAWADAMRCGTRLIREGDTRSAVRELCGEPVDIQTRTILRRPFYDASGRFIYFGDGLVEVPVEVWTYNFGPYKLMRRIRFVDGLVDEIETLGYGYHSRSEEAREEPRRRETY
ncbi:MAG TPA: DUF2845 domain-containing protein [Steroidobacter sp.]